jgi:hypothetical protein
MTRADERAPMHGNFLTVRSSYAPEQELAFIWYSFDIPAQTDRLRPTCCLGKTKERFARLE